MTCADQHCGGGDAEMLFALVTHAVIILVEVVMLTHAGGDAKMLVVSHLMKQSTMCGPCQSVGLCSW